ncbi:neutral/alkaline non-lysosomal ceramidase N-terminal domain-containing protein [Clostridium intestinale]|uniref:Neutral ceramidase n=1 Tax=Clostridium intestinale DSM 6191 TaxID=1121320 RepID=A0A1M5ZW77_9CLOT|nr:neutral/alkaline non-lysosomal ceramidase N-terminal domain-containing protein [Clostridium intestinale]SHI28504.1 Neutral/alkaline non-lysosomal ceramidase, N-terminal [Clostridium intestinale DSM 6191]
MEISFSQEKFDLKAGMKIAGYGGRVACGVNDDLKARVIVFKEDGEFYPLIQLDLLAIDYYFSDLIKKNIEEKLAIKKENIMINCSHTHSGIAGVVNTDLNINKRYLGTFDKFNEDLASSIIEKIITSIEKSQNSMEKFKIYYNRKTVEGICTDRNNPSNYIDNLLQTINIETESKRKAVIYNYACHPTVLEGTNKYITADFVGETSRVLEDGGVAVAMFYNGACGNISTRFTKKESSFNEVKRIGGTLGVEVLKLIEDNKEELELSKITIKSKTISLKVKEIGTEESIRAKMSQIEVKIKEALDKGLDKNSMKPYYFELEGARRNLDLLGSFEDIKTIDLKVNLFKAKDIYMVYIPGELFSSLGDKIKNEFYDKKVIIVTYSNGYIGYIPDEEAYEKGCFEVMLSPLDKGEGEKLVYDVIEMIKKI